MSSPFFPSTPLIAVCAAMTPSRPGLYGVVCIDTPDSMTWLVVRLFQEEQPTRECFATGSGPMNKAAGCLMIQACELFEVHLTVRSLDKAIDFYRDIVGLTLAHVAKERRAAFLWIGSAPNGVLGLWEVGSGPQS